MPSSTSPISRLSQELIDKIIDYIYFDDRPWFGKKSLQQCALVSRSFRPRSQFHIFSSISLGGYPRTREEKIQNLFAIIQRNPDIAHYVQELSLKCDFGYYSWVTVEDPIFIAVMDRISSNRPLRKLTINADSDTVSCNRYNQTQIEDPQSLVDHFFLPFITPFITSLSLHRLENVPIEVVASCVNLIDLELLHVGLEVSGERRNSVPHHHLRLQRLLHNLSQTALEILLNLTLDMSGSSLDLSQLKTLIVYTDGLSDLEFEQQIIDASCGSLEEIYLRTMHPGWNRIFHGFANLHDSPRLRVLHAHVLFPEDNLVSICQTLSTIRAGCLEELFIEAKVAFFEHAECKHFGPDVVFRADWATFCSEVSRVMSGEGSRFEFEMTYAVRNLTEMDFDDYVDIVDDHCQSVIAELRRDELSSLENNFTTTLSHHLAFGAKFAHNTFS